MFGVLALQGERPLVNVYVNGELLAGYRIDPCRKSDDYRGLFLHCCVRILPGLGLMIDGLFVVRTAKEDQMLREELPGYADYARRVRYRLVIGLW